MSKNFIPPAIEEMIKSLNDNTKNKALRETQLAMMERSVVALTTAITQYKQQKVARK